MLLIKERRSYFKANIGKNEQGNEVMATQGMPIHRYQDYIYQV